MWSKWAATHTTAWLVERGQGDAMWSKWAATHTTAWLVERGQGDAMWIFLGSHPQNCQVGRAVVLLDPLNSVHLHFSNGLVGQVMQGSPSLHSPRLAICQGLKTTGNMKLVSVLWSHKLAIFRKGGCLLKVKQVIFFFSFREIETTVFS